MGVQQFSFVCKFSNVLGPHCKSCNFHESSRREEGPKLKLHFLKAVAQKPKIVTMKQTRKLHTVEFQMTSTNINHQLHFF